MGVGGKVQFAEMGAHCKVQGECDQGRSDGGIYRYIPPLKKKISLPYKFLLAVLFTCGTLTCFDFEIGMTS